MKAIILAAEKVQGFIQLPFQNQMLIEYMMKQSLIYKLLKQLLVRFRC